MKQYCNDYNVISLHIEFSAYMAHADLLVIRGVQGASWDGKGCFLQVAQMETEQA